MKTRLVLFLTAILFFISFIPVSGQASSFSGEWKLNREKSNLGDNQLIMTKLTVMVKGDSLLTTRTYETGDGSEYPFEENLILDGKDCKITIYDMPRVTKSITKNDGSIAVESKTTFMGGGGEDNLVSKESWKTGDAGKNLIIEFANSMTAGSTSGSFYFERIK